MHAQQGVYCVLEVRDNSHIENGIELFLYLPTIKLSVDDFQAMNNFNTKNDACIISDMLLGNAG